MDSDKIQKRIVPHLKAENLIITVHFMHFLRKITVRAVTDQNACIIFFVTVPMKEAIYLQHLLYKFYNHLKTYILSFHKKREAISMQNLQYQI